MLTSVCEQQEEFYIVHEEGTGSVNVYLMVSSKVSSTSLIDGEMKLQMTSVFLLSGLRREYQRV